MASTPRWGGLRLEPYDPDARDADGDGIVQEGTAWERPVGVQLIDELGRAIARGQRAKDPVRGLRYVDRNGQEVFYKPTWTKFVQPGGTVGSKPTKQTGLARLGVPSLKDRGHLSILDMQVTARSTMSAVLERPAPVRPYVGKDGAKRFIAEHPKYTTLVQADRSAKIEPNSYFREGLEDEAMVVIAKAQGFDGKPTPVTREMADAAVAQGGIRIYRGMPEPEHTTMLRSGEYYSGRGVHGSGYYFGTSPGKSLRYLGDGPWEHPLNDVLTEMILHPDAKVISVDELRAEVAADKSLSLVDLGHLAAMRGYDAMSVGESLRDPSPVKGPEYVVFNRGALLLPPQPTADELLAMANDFTYGRPKMQSAREFSLALRQDSDFISKTLEEKMDYLPSIISDHKEQGLFTGYLQEMLERLEEEYRLSASAGQKFRRALRRKKP